MSEQHFKGRYEVELKYRIHSKAEFVAQLNAIEHQVMLTDNLESDSYFDCNASLLAQGKSLCIHEMEPSGIKLWIVKGPEADRCEATNITDAVSAKSMLKTMGYEVALTMQKTRSIYFFGKFHITVDHLQDIGDFAEFAIMTDEETKLDEYRQQLQESAYQFGLTDSDIEPQSYRQLQSQLLA